MRILHISVRVPARRSALAACLLAGGALAGCVLLAPAGAPCEVDADCGDGLACARNGECAAGLRSVYIGWTVAGQPAGEAACADIASLAVTFADAEAEAGGLAAEIVYQPVPCALGQIRFDRMPDRLDRVDIDTRGSDGRTSQVASVPLQQPGMRIEIDLRQDGGQVNCRACVRGLFSATHEHARRGTD